MATIPTPPPQLHHGGLVPPHSIEAEQAVLGAVLLSDKPMYQYIVTDGLRASDFYRERHGLIFESMLELWNDGEQIDVLTVTEHLRARGKLDEVGGPGEVDALTAATPAVGGLRKYGQIVKELSLERGLLASTYEIQAKVHAHELSTRDLIEWAERTVLEVAHDESAKDFRDVGAVIDEETDRWYKLSTGEISLTGTPSGFTGLDEATGGFQPGNLIILAARPGMGKSAMVTNIAANVALNKDKPSAVALFSLEMSEGELAQRFISAEAKIRGEDLRKGRLKDERKWKKVMEAAERFSSAPLYLDDSSDLSILDLRAKCRRLHQQLPGGLGLIIIDYLQLMRPDGRIDSRVEQIGQMSRGLKVLAGELKVPVIALSQLSRAVESRTDKRPQLSDLRESGNIEQDADLVLFIYRDEYYSGEQSERPGEADLIIAKNRHGSLDDVPLAFQGEYTRFMNLSRADAY